VVVLVVVVVVVVLAEPVLLVVVLVGVEVIRLVREDVLPAAGRASSAPHAASGTTASVPAAASPAAYRRVNGASKCW
jgi:hypothetical protein